mmetsp:Transcript_10242/g.19380  ORF Transcript_10242/g.19380 Transcript_10242/m.19380 type:complete len:128 (+) Transcript_10242:1918-2301(+)
MVVIVIFVLDNCNGSFPVCVGMKIDSGSNDEAPKSSEVSADDPKVDTSDGGKIEDEEMKDVQDKPDAEPTTTDASVRAEGTLEEEMKEEKVPIEEAALVESSVTAAVETKEAEMSEVPTEPEATAEE